MITTWLLALAGPTSLSVTPQSCRQQASIRSLVTADDRRREHVFQNGLAVPLQLSWIDPAGKRTALGTIAPGAILSQQTNLGHAFVLTDPAGKCRATVRVGEVLSGSYMGTSRYRAAAVSGWHVYLDQVLAPGNAHGRDGLAAVTRALRQIEGTVPAAALAQLRQTPIFLHDHSGYAAMYHPHADWLVAHGRTVELLHGVEISNAAMFAEDVERPGGLLHELAHAYHWRLPAEDRAAIDAAYRAARTAGLYAKVKRADGSVGPAYAEASPFEYFAELSEAWLSRNDFYPFTRTELESHDPAGAALMRRLWR